MHDDDYFNSKIALETFVNAIDENVDCIFSGYVLNNESFKRGIFQESISTFFAECNKYYHISKKKYLERKLTYNSFTTVLRQICNFNNITYTSQIKYDKSNYDIVYYIYF
jgi:hypothetical protein